MTPTVREAARSLGLQDLFTDGLGIRRRTPEPAVRALLEALADGATAAEAPPSVALARAGGARLTIRGIAANGPLRPVELHLEDGPTIRLSPRHVATRDHRMLIRLPDPLPMGVHRLMLRGGRRHRSMLVLAAPRSIPLSPDLTKKRLAVFLPLHALHSRHSLGAGDFSDLARLVDWARESASALVGTLPLFPAFLDEPFEPSPYMPVTRLFWNELFVDPAAMPEFHHPSVREVARSPRWRADLGRARRGDWVDYRLAMQVRRRLLEAMAEAAFANPVRRAEIEQAARRTPDLEDYARFRAAVDATGRAWRQWPASQRSGRLPRTADREAQRRFYLYAQAAAAEQIARLSAHVPSGSPLYLDLPVGVHPDGFDTWRRPELFLTGVSVGAPPDALQTLGQVWGLPPMHPTAGRADGYAHLRAVLRRLFSVTGMLRIDHVMGLHRLYCVPHGFDGRHGAYLRYPAEELYAIVLMEAARANALVVGENLGTVPREVNRALQRHGLLGMHVQQFEFHPQRRKVISLPGTRQLAALNTHDLPTFPAFWAGDDIELRRRLRAIDQAEADRERADRRRLRAAVARELKRMGLPARNAADVCRSLLRLHAQGPAPVQLVSLEDLWSERRPQNVPGITEGYPNWRRRASRSLEAITADRGLRRLLETLAKLRAGASTTPSRHASGNRRAPS